MPLECGSTKYLIKRGYYIGNKIWQLKLLFVELINGKTIHYEFLPQQCSLLDKLPSIYVWVGGGEGGGGGDWQQQMMHMVHHRRL